LTSCRGQACHGPVDCRTIGESTALAAKREGKTGVTEEGSGPASAIQPVILLFDPGQVGRFTNREGQMALCAKVQPPACRTPLVAPMMARFCDTIIHEDPVMNAPSVPS
jgi:hypothetical protein